MWPIVIILSHHRSYERIKIAECQLPLNIHLNFLLLQASMVRNSLLLVVRYSEWLIKSVIFHGSWAEMLNWANSLEVRISRLGWTEVPPAMIVHMWWLK
jgi:hypothetical protein